MIDYRPFRNCDPPHLVEVWRSQAPSRGLAQGVSLDVLERLVFSKTYFDREGLIVAEEEGQLVGYAHAGFGPNDSHSSLSTQRGVTCLVLVAPHPQGDEIASALLQRSERYLAGHGAEQLWGGCWGDLCPFYLGLYGGSAAPGVLLTDPRMQSLLTRHGYEPAEQVVVLHRRLQGFRAVVNREQLQIRRRFTLSAQLDPPARTWWEASTTAVADRTQFSLQGRDGGPPVGRAMFCEMESLSQTWGVHACGLTDLDWSELPSQQEAVFLLAESLRQLQNQGVHLIETQRPPDHPDLPLLQSLGFEPQDSGVGFRKQL